MKEERKECISELSDNVRRSEGEECTLWLIRVSRTKCRDIPCLLDLGTGFVLSIIHGASPTKRRDGSAYFKARRFIRNACEATKDKWERLATYLDESNQIRTQLFTRRCTVAALTAP